MAGSYSAFLVKNASIGPFILWKIITIVVTKCQILRRKCTKFNFCWGYAPGPTGGAYSNPPEPIAGFKGPTSKREGGEGKRRRKEKGEEKGRGRKRTGGKGEKGGEGIPTCQCWRV